MEVKVILVIAVLHCCASVPSPHHYHRRRVPMMRHPSSMMPFVPFEPRYPEIPPPNPLVDPNRSIRFRLFTRDNPHNGQEMTLVPKKSLRQPYYDPNRPTKILIHGALDSGRGLSGNDWMNAMKLAYLEREDANVIVVDYSFYILLLLYWSSLPYLYAHRIAELAYHLSDNGKNLGNFHLVGRSWGAHVAGMTGHSLCGKIGRITGLDPANPPLRFVGFHYRLDKTDAQFVDVYHLNGKPRFNIFTAVGIANEYDGLSPPMGHVDIYPNFRERQSTGCPVENSSIFPTGYCELGMGTKLFTETIKKNDTFLICPCESFFKYLRGECPCEANELRYMGEAIPQTSFGVYQMMSKSQVKPKPTTTQSSTTEISSDQSSTAASSTEASKPAEDLPAAGGPDSAAVASESSTIVTSLPSSQPGSSTTNAPPSSVTSATEIVLSTESAVSSTPATVASASSTTEADTANEVSPSGSASTPSEVSESSSTEGSVSPVPAAETTVGVAASSEQPQESKVNSIIISEDGQSVSGSALGRNSGATL